MRKNVVWIHVKNQYCLLFHWSKITGSPPFEMSSDFQLWTHKVLFMPKSLGKCRENILQRRPPWLTYQACLSLNDMDSGSLWKSIENWSRISIQLHFFCLYSLQNIFKPPRSFSWSFHQTQKSIQIELEFMRHSIRKWLFTRA